MLSYCLKCRKNTERINPRVSKSSNSKTMKCANELYVVVKNQDLLKNKKKREY